MRCFTHFTYVNILYNKVLYKHRLIVLDIIDQIYEDKTNSLKKKKKKMGCFTHGTRREILVYTIWVQIRKIEDVSTSCFGIYLQTVETRKCRYGRQVHGENQ
jgi:hypothetical protein